MPELPKTAEIFISILTVLGNEQKGLPRYEIISRVKKQTYVKNLPLGLLSQKTRKGYNMLSSSIGWALSNLYMAGYIERPSRGHYRVTAKGKQVLKEGSLTLTELRNQPEYSNAPDQEPSDKNDKSQDEKSPHHVIQEELGKIEKETKRLLLDELRSTDPDAFEDIVLDLLRAMGYGGKYTESPKTPKAHDGGIDGIITEDKLGLDKIYIQAKRFSKTKVGTPLMNEFIGTITSGDANKGIFITTSEFTEKARSKTTAIKGSNLRIILINGNELVRLMYEYDIGVRKELEVVIKEIDTNFFDDYE